LEKIARTAGALGKLLRLSVADDGASQWKESFAPPMLAS
jgi:hypothetical protein